ncbi:hypothetical protein J7L01_04540, partial [bacterium]|nr:hypothetical protein [bacterium]
YNGAGAFAGEAAFNWDAANDELDLANPGRSGSTINVENSAGGSAIRVLGAGSFDSGGRLNFGDGSYVYIEEDVDDDMLIHAYDLSLEVRGTKGSSGQVLTSDGTHVSWQDGGGGTSLWNDNGNNISPVDNDSVRIFDMGSSNVYLTVSSDEWTGVWSKTTATNASGVLGYADGSGKYGVFGYNTVDADWNAAVNASATGTTNKVYGVHAECATSMEYAAAIYGFCTAADGPPGVMGIGNNAPTIYSFAGSGVVGVGTRGVMGTYYNNEDVFGFLGGEPTTNYGNYCGVGGQNSNTGTGQWGIAGHIDGDPGTGYSPSSVNAAVYGEMYGDSYTYGTYGYHYAVASRGGGSMGAYSSVTWGSCGYYSSGGTSYGGYFTSYTSGAGRARPTPGEEPASSDEAIGIAVGAEGELMGGWFKGNLYGLHATGKHYAAYADGDVMTNSDYIVLVDSDEEDRIPTYAMTSVTRDIYTHGVGKITDGEGRVVFPQEFRDAIDPDEAITVTATPIGVNNGLFIVSYDSNGFVVRESDGHSGEGKFSWIAIGQRRGTSTAELASEVISSDFDGKMRRGLGSEIGESGDGIYYSGGELIETTPPVRKVEQIGREKKQKLPIDEDSRKTTGPETGGVETSDGAYRSNADDPYGF